MRREVQLPSMGEDAGSDAKVAFWMAQEGDHIGEGDDLIELTTDKAAFTVPSPYSGVIVERLVEEGADLAVGDVICIIET